MRKLLPHIPLITIITLVIGFFVMPHTAHAGVGDLVLDSLFGSVNVLYGVLGKIFWWGLIPFASMVFSLLGTIIDLALAMSFERGFYNAEAISLAWGVIRDIANMFFIFILIYEGIKTTLNLGNLVTVRKTITSVIIAALFLNFSLFFTKVIIDVSNVAATWFMQGITNIGGNESVSFSIGSTLGMEKLATKYSGNSEDLKNIGLQSFTTGVLLFALLCIAIYVFFNFLFLVIGRIVSFIFLLITAPIGFVGPMVPMLQDYSKKWWKELNDQAMMLPMFFLMVYLTLFIVDRIQTFLISSSSSDFTPANYIIFIIIIMMLLKSLKVAEDYSGEIGKMVGGLAKNATTFVGGAALIGTVGKAASFVQNTQTMQRIASSGKLGKFAMTGVKATADASFGTKTGYSGVMKSAGLDKTAIGDQFKGTDKGYSGKIEQEKKDEKEYAKLLGKGIKGAQNRARYAENIKNGPVGKWTRSIVGGAAGGLAGAVLGGGVGAIPGAAIGAAAARVDRGDEGAAKDIAKEAKAEYKKEARNLVNEWFEMTKPSEAEKGNANNISLKKLRQDMSANPRVDHPDEVRKIIEHLEKNGVTFKPEEKNWDGIEDILRKGDEVVADETAGQIARVAASGSGSAAAPTPPPAPPTPPTP